MSWSLLAAVPALILAACGGPEQAPEERIRQLVSSVETASEAHDLSVFKDRISSGYQDARGYDRQTVLRIIQGVLLRNRQIHLLSVVRRLDVDDAAAQAVVLVAMAGRPIESARALVDVRADLMRFDVALALEDDAWRVRSVDWRRAEMSDFL